MLCLSLFLISRSLLCRLTRWWPLNCLELLPSGTNTSRPNGGSLLYRWLVVVFSSSWQLWWLGMPDIKCSSPAITRESRGLPWRSLGCFPNHHYFNGFDMIPFLY